MVMTAIVQDFFVTTEHLMAANASADQTTNKRESNAVARTTLKVVF